MIQKSQSKIIDCSKSIKMHVGILKIELLKYIPGDNDELAKILLLYQSV